jgi:quercetin dioxygenase-like cupin family protein
MTARKRKQPEAPLDEATIAKMARAIAPMELSAERRESMRARIMARIEPPANTFTIRADQGEWISIGPGVEMKMLRIDRERNNQTVMFRMQPGSQIVPHRHTQEEECLVLEGEIMIGEYRIGPGDMHIAMPGARHPALLAPRGALVCIRSEIPPQSFQIA